ncbi:MAG: hypothetical protein K0R65_2518 [Crocinitomicaceae bacterium]|jgi:hypothetical protein|nr:hypothetical protein [Crocinitomicaceae bacterium]
MKKLAFTFICFLFLSFKSFGQPVLDHIFGDLDYHTNDFGDNYHTIMPYYLSSGLKYFKIYSASNTVEVYNADYSFHSYLMLPDTAGNVQNSESFFFSDKLFDLDDDIEYTYAGYNPQTFRIYNQDGSILFQQNFCRPNSTTYNNVYTTGNQNFVYFSEADSTFKMSLYYHTSLASTVRVYTLPGTLAGYNLNCCCPGGMAGIQPVNDPFFSGMQVYPNPSQGVNIVQIPEGVSQGKILLYNMQGEELKSVDIPVNSKQVEINNSLLPSGTYLYKLVSTDLKQELSKKVLIIK